MEEQLAVITGLWTTPVGETFSFDGKHYSVTDSPALPKPVQQPKPPIVIGGGGQKRTPRLAAAYADEYNAGFDAVDGTQAAFDRVRAAVQAAGRPESSMIYSAAQTVCCGRDDAEIERRAAATGSSLDDLRRSGLAGTPDEIVAKIGQFAGIGTAADLPSGARPGRHRAPGTDRRRGAASGLTLASRPSRWLSSRPAARRSQGRTPARRPCRQRDG